MALAVVDNWTLSRQWLVPSCIRSGVDRSRCGLRTGSRLETRVRSTIRVLSEWASAGQSVSYFTVPPRAHPSTGSQSGSATPGLTQVPSRSLPPPGGYSIVASEARSIVGGCTGSLWGGGIGCSRRARASSIQYRPLRRTAGRVMSVTPSFYITLVRNQYLVGFVDSFRTGMVKWSAKVVLNRF